MVCQVVVFDERLYSTSIVCLLNSIRRGLQGQGPLVDGESREPSERFSGRLFLFLLEPKGDTAQRPAFGKEEGGCEYGAFAAPAEAEWSRLLLTLRRFFFFLRKEKEKNGAQKTRAGNARPYGIYFGAVENREPTIPPSRLRRATSLYTREASAAVGQKRAAPSGPPFRTGSSGCFPAGRRRRLRL